MAAISASKLEKRVAIVERTLCVGGICLHKGTIPSKTLREAASYLSGVNQREVYGSAYRVKEKVTINHFRAAFKLELAKSQFASLLQKVSIKSGRRF